MSRDEPLKPKNTKFLVSLILLVIGCLIAVGGTWYNVQHFGEKLEAQRGQRVANIWMNRGVNLFDLGHFTFTEAKVSVNDNLTMFHVIESSEIMRFVLLDKSGKAFFSTDPRQTGQQVIPVETMNAYKPGDVDYSEEYIDTQEFNWRQGRYSGAAVAGDEAAQRHRVAVYKVPYFDHGELQGTLIVEEDRTSSAAGRGETVARTGVVLCGVLLTIFLISGGLIYSFVRERGYHIAALSASRDDAVKAEAEARSMSGKLTVINQDMAELNRELADNVNKLRQAQDEIIRKGKMAQLGQLTATVAHDLRNPLGAVRTAAYVIERRVKDQPLGIEKPLGRISKGVERCNTIITELLDFARTSELQLEKVDLDEWLTEQVREQAGRLPESVTIECRLALDGEKVHIDPSKLNRALVNLMTNACEAMIGDSDTASGGTGKEAKLVVASLKTNRGIEIHVQDNGPGMEDDVVKKIMEPLFTTKSSGVGLGMPAIEKILEQHKGGLDVHTKLGEGTTMVVWFPTTEPAKEAA